MFCSRRSKNYLFVPQVEEIPVKKHDVSPLVPVLSVSRQRRKRGTIIEQSP